MSVAKCPNCGTSIPADGRFCPSCGLSLEGVSPARPAVRESNWVDFVDRCWEFFASTRVAISLIVLIAVASVAGSLIEQESLYQDWRPPHLYYPERYGPLWGPLFMRLGLTHAYSSVWFASLVLLLVVSLIICSLHRLVPLHRTLTRPQVYKLPHFLERQQVVMTTETGLDGLAASLRRRGFQIRRDRECLYADRGRLSRYGPYIIHIGLIIVAFAAFAKALPGWDLTKDVWIPDGQTVKVPDTNFAITNHKFTLEFYPSGAPSRFATDASILEEGRQVRRQSLEVNHPINHQGWDIYQASWREEPGVARVKVVSAFSKQPVATLGLDLRQPETEYAVTAEIKMVVTAYYHDFIVDPATRQPGNASFEVKNPVFMVEFLDTKQGTSLGRAAAVVMGTGNPVFDGALFLQTEKVETRWFTGLKLHKDLTTPYMFTGLAIVLLGMAITFFFFHWQVWAREENGRVLVGARAYKNKFGLKQELKRLLG